MADWDELAAALEGDVVPRGAARFEERCRALIWNGRKIDRRPAAIARVASADDVRSAVRFARERGLRVAVRGAGHSWCAAPLREGGLVLDLDRLRGVELDAREGTASCGPAVRGETLLEATLPQGWAFPVGHCQGVPLSGYLLAGGFGWNSGAWGPACASVLALDVVDARGVLVRASEDENADLFWAARGAGPGFPGVVVRYHLRLHRAPEAIRTSVLAVPLEERGAVGRWLPELRARLAPAVELNVRVGPAPAGVTELVLAATAFAASEAQAAELLAPFEEGARFSRARLEPRAETPLPALLESLAPLFPRGARYGADVFWCADSAGDVLAVVAEQLAGAPSAASFALLVPVPAPAPDAPPPPDMAFALSAPLFVGVYGVWEGAADDGANLAWLRGVQADDGLGRLSIGHYVGESDLTAAHRRAERSFPPEAWRRLADVRARHDPDGVFFDFPDAPRP